MLKKCFGIISYFLDDPSDRAKRIARFNSLLKQLNLLWPSIDILVIAQNWQDYKLPEIKNKIIVHNYNRPLTIIGARNKLKEHFLQYDYDYIILLDDDAEISYDSPTLPARYMEELDRHPNGFCFIHSKNHWHTCDDYAPAPLNLCAISRVIYEQAANPRACLEKNEALEDDLYAVYLHTKYLAYEFYPPEGIRCSQYNDLQYSNPELCWPSTWHKKDKSNFMIIVANTKSIMNYILKYKEYPPDNILQDIYHQYK